MLTKSSRPPLLGGLKVLVVEDDEDSRELLGELLATEGADVHMAADAARGMTEFVAFAPDVLVSDIGLPGEDGYAFMRRCRGLADPKLRRTPAVALTAYTRPADRAQAKAAGFDDFLAKPLDIQKLLQLVARLAASPPSAT